MCGRFTLRATASELVEVFGLLRVPQLAPRYNIAPTQPVAFVHQTSAGRELEMARWGLIPSWAKDAKIGSSLINARSETADTKPSFRAAFKRRRCLIAADGFYEWLSSPDSSQKQPFWIGVRDTPVLAFAGLWEQWSNPVLPEDSPVTTCTILTTTANDLLRPLHDRMPVILDPVNFERWLDPAISTAESLSPLLVAFPAERMYRYPVSTLVNSPRNETSECVAPIATN